MGSDCGTKLAKGLSENACPQLKKLFLKVRIFNIFSSFPHLENRIIYWAMLEYLPLE